MLEYLHEKSEGSAVTCFRKLLVYLAIKRIKAKGLKPLTIYISKFPKCQQKRPWNHNINKILCFIFILLLAILE